MDDTAKEYITVEKFLEERDEDFELWSMRIMSLLKGREYAEIINGKENAPGDKTTTEYATWVTKAKKARAIILNSLGDKPLRAAHLCHLRSEMYTKLR